MQSRDLVPLESPAERLLAKKERGELALTNLPDGEPCYAIPSGRVDVGVFFSRYFPENEKPRPQYIGVVRHEGELLPEEIAAQLPLRFRPGTTNHLHFLERPSAQGSIIGIPPGSTLGTSYPMDVLVPKRVFEQFLATVNEHVQRREIGESRIKALPPG